MELSSSGGYEVYLDKFVSFPHLPIHPDCKEPPSRRKYHVIPPNISHTGVVTKFNPPVERAVYPSGTLTNQYIENAFWQGRKTARAVMKHELSKIRSANEKTVKMESQLLEVEERRQKYSSLCEKQVHSEIEELQPMTKIGFNTFTSSPSPSTFNSEHLQQPQTNTSKKKKTKKMKTTKPLSPLQHTRQKKIYNRESLISCILDTTDMSVCSQDSLHNYDLLQDSSSKFKNSEPDESLSLSSGSKLNRSKLINIEKWDYEALRLAYPEVEDDGDSISLELYKTIS